MVASLEGIGLIFYTRVGQDRSDGENERDGSSSRLHDDVDPARVLRITNPVLTKVSH